MAGRRLGLGFAGEKEGEGEQHVVGELLMLQGDQGGEEEATAGRATRRQAAAVFALSPQ